MLGRVVDLGWHCRGEGSRRRGCIQCSSDLADSIGQADGLAAEVGGRAWETGWRTLAESCVCHGGLAGGFRRAAGASHIGALPSPKSSSRPARRRAPVRSLRTMPPVKRCPFVIRAATRCGRSPSADGARFPSSRLPSSAIFSVAVHGVPRQNGKRDRSSGGATDEFHRDLESHHRNRSSRSSMRTCPIPDTSAARSTVE